MATRTRRERGGTHRPSRRNARLGARVRGPHSGPAGLRLARSPGLCAVSNLGLAGMVIKLTAACLALAGRRATGTGGATVPSGSAPPAQAARRRCHPPGGRGPGPGSHGGRHLRKPAGLGGPARGPGPSGSPAWGSLPATQRAQHAGYGIMVTGPRRGPRRAGVASKLATAVTVQ